MSDIIFEATFEKLGENQDPRKENNWKKRTFKVNTLESISYYDEKSEFKGSIELSDLYDSHKVGYYEIKEEVKKLLETLTSNNTNITNLNNTQRNHRIKEEVEKLLGTLKSINTNNKINKINKYIELFSYKKIIVPTEISFKKRFFISENVKVNKLKQGYIYFIIRGKKDKYDEYSRDFYCRIKDKSTFKDLLIVINNLIKCGSLASKSCYTKGIDSKNINKEKKLKNILWEYKCIDESNNIKTEGLLDKQLYKTIKFELKKKDKDPSKEENWEEKIFKLFPNGLGYFSRESYPGDIIEIAKYPDGLARGKKYQPDTPEILITYPDLIYYEGFLGNLKYVKIENLNNEYFYFLINGRFNDSFYCRAKKGREREIKNWIDKMINYRKFTNLNINFASKPKNWQIEEARKYIYGCHENDDEISGKANEKYILREPEQAGGKKTRRKSKSKTRKIKKSNSKKNKSKKVKKSKSKNRSKKSKIKK